MALELGSSESWLLPLLYKNKKITSDSYSPPLPPFPFTLKPFAGKWTATQQRKKCGNHIRCRTPKRQTLWSSVTTACLGKSSIPWVQILGGRELLIFEVYWHKNKEEHFANWRSSIVVASYCWAIQEMQAFIFLSSLSLVISANSLVQKLFFQQKCDYSKIESFHILCTLSLCGKWMLHSFFMELTKWDEVKQWARWQLLSNADKVVSTGCS